MYKEKPYLKNISKRRKGKIENKCSYICSILEKFLNLTKIKQTEILRNISTHQCTIYGTLLKRTNSFNTQIYQTKHVTITHIQNLHINKIRDALEYAAVHVYSQMFQPEVENQGGESVTHEENDDS